MLLRKLRIFSLLALCVFLWNPLSWAESVERKTVNGLFPEEIIRMEQLLEKIKNNESFLLLDARSKKTFNQGHIQGARLPLTEEYYRQEDLFKDGIIKSPPDRASALKTAMAAISRDTPIVTYCNTGCHAGSVLALQIKQLGFTHVKAYEDGYQTWEQKGYPVYPVKAAR